MILIYNALVENKIIVNFIWIFMKYILLKNKYHLNEFLIILNNTFEDLIENPKSKSIFILLKKVIDKIFLLIHFKMVIILMI
jgi:hypothetical protein